MFLYELAIELDRKSGELVDAAASMGMGQLMASSTLDPAQVHQLRQRFAAGAAAPMPGPAAFAPPSAGAPVPPPAPGPPAAVAPGPATFAPPVAFEPAAPVGGPTGLPAGTPPPPPGELPPAPSAPRAPRGDGFDRNQRIAIGVVVALVVGLFGYMVATSGPDAEQRAIAADAAAPADATTTSAAPTSTTTTAAPTTSVAQDLTVPVDAATFCDGGRSVVAFHLRISAAIVDEDLANLQEVARVERAAWDGALDQVSVGGPPALVDEVERYQAGVGRWLDALAGGAGLVDAEAQAGGIEFLRALNAGDEFIRQVPFYCE